MIFEKSMSVSVIDKVFSDLEVSKFSKALFLSEVELLSNIMGRGKSCMTVFLKFAGEVILSGVLP
jgi:hypothetical protein